jgi:hypothetical protein
MSKAPIYIGNIPAAENPAPVKGEFVTRNGQKFYRIANYDLMRPFFMSIVSPSDHWLFISSNGALSAGRKNPQHALFPYYTDDKIHDSPELTGSKTILLVEKEGKKYLWEPFSERYRGVYQTTRNLYKHIVGNQIIFEETNQDLGLTFSYTWATSKKSGFVKKSQLQSSGSESLTVSLLDGLQNILPYGVNLDMQTELSTLVDAYKKNELDLETGMGIYILSSILVDKPEPSEALKATTVWSTGLDNAQYLLCSKQLDDFRQGNEVEQETDIRAERGAYFIRANVDLNAGEEKTWYTIAEIEQGPADVQDLRHFIQNESAFADKLEDEIKLGTIELEAIVASSDGIQLSEDRLGTTRHFANTLFNVMRGGIYADQYRLKKEDLLAFVTNWNEPIAIEKAQFFTHLPDYLTLNHLLEAAREQNDPQLMRLCYEYLPLTFSRRHGDPSRPWNFFSIETKDEEGNQILSYQGNWRDIFQNWEALSISFPEFIESIIAKFVNASTADGYNPYRITRDGIDWEVHDPHDPWAFIGYWGDHQLIYLLKLLQISRDYHPQVLSTFLSQRIFAYSNVPYRIKPFEELWENPRDTIVYDYDLEAILEKRVEKLGADGKLILDKEENVYLVNLTEKLLVTILAKVSNFVPEGGIWMNTQRPEWNDANNALVGYGISMVTLCYLRQFMIFCKEWFEHIDENSMEVSVEVAQKLEEIARVLKTYLPEEGTKIRNELRKEVVVALGKAGSNYREKIYKNGFSGEMVTISKDSIIEFFDTALIHADHSIRANKREDDLYHSYNLLNKNVDAGVGVRYLYEMLEGQVAVLSSEFLSVEESIKLLKALKQSALYRKDQFSYLLYPDRNLPRFLEKNHIPAEKADHSALFRELVRNGNTDLIEVDVYGQYHFNGNFRNADSVKAALKALAEKGYQDLVERETEYILDVFEEIFDHQSFTGRSGTFYGYEGLGSIYWHMVSKLLLAVCDTYYRAVREGADEESLNRLVEHYYDIRAGIGHNKSPEVYGAFPTDPYSHTPGNAGAQQPGMTGQVKEDILSRMGELGVVVKGGQIHFSPVLLRKSEFLSEAGRFRYHPIHDESREIEYPASSLFFTLCQTPVVYTLSDQPHIVVSWTNGQQETINGLVLSRKISEEIFRRTGYIQKLEVFLNTRID